MSVQESPRCSPTVLRRLPPPDTSFLCFVISGSSCCPQEGGKNQFPSAVHRSSAMPLCYARCLLITPRRFPSARFGVFFFFSNIRNDTEHECNCSNPPPDPNFYWNPSLILATLGARVLPTSKAASEERASGGAGCRRVPRRRANR